MAKMNILKQISTLSAESLAAGHAKNAESKRMDAARYFATGEEWCGQMALRRAKEEDRLARKFAAIAMRRAKQ